jgi:hypothetical protein
MRDEMRGGVSGGAGREGNALRMNSRGGYGTRPPTRGDGGVSPAGFHQSIVYQCRWDLQQHTSSFQGGFPGRSVPAPYQLRTYQGHEEPSALKSANGLHSR